MYVYVNINININIYIYTYISYHGKLTEAPKQEPGSPGRKGRRGPGFATRHVPAASPAPGSLLEVYNTANFFPSYKARTKPALKGNNKANRV